MKTRKEAKEKRIYLRIAWHREHEMWIAKTQTSPRNVCIHLNGTANTASENVVILDMNRLYKTIWQQGRQRTTMKCNSARVQENGNEKKQRWNKWQIAHAYDSVSDRTYCCLLLAIIIHTHTFYWCHVETYWKHTVEHLQSVSNIHAHTIQSTIYENESN